MEALIRRAEIEAPPGISVEPKTLALTLHFRHAQKSAGWVKVLSGSGRCTKYSPLNKRWEMD